MKQMKRFTLVLVLVMVFALVLGCNAKKEDTSAKAESVKKIAYLTPSTTTPFWNWVEAGIQAAADEKGYKLIVYDSVNDSATQLKNAQNAITTGIAGIIISPTDSASCPAVLEEAEKSKVPVTICDIGTDSGKYLTYVSTKNYDGAYAVGDYLGKYLVEKGIKGSVGEITIPLSRINGQLRCGGFEDAMAKHGFEVNTILETSDWTVDEADGQTRNIVTANSDLVAVFANHDQATLGAISAIKDLNLDGKVQIASFDGNADIVDYLLKGEILVCGAQQAMKMGKESLYALDDFFNGKTVPEEIALDVLLLTADNVEGYLDVIATDVCPME